MPTPLPPDTCKVYTPTGLAKAMIRALGMSDRKRWLEPSFGHGVFLEVLSNLGVPPGDVVGIDLDPVRHKNDLRATVYRGIDFLGWASRTVERFDRVVGNPPYIPLRKVQSTIRKAAIRNLRTTSARSGTANTWAAFLSSSLELLNGGASLAFVLPSSWDYADYAERIRQRVYKSFEKVEVHRCLQPIFSDVKEGSVVLVCHNFGGSPQEPDRNEYEDVNALIAGIENRSHRKSTLVEGYTQSFGKRKLVRFGDIFDLRIGAVTGDSRFFLLNPTQVEQHRLPEQAITPILTKSRHLKWASITSTRYRSLITQDERIWLFRPTQEVLGASSVRKYMRMDFKVGGCNRTAFKIARRKEWHQVPLDLEADGFVSGMSKHGPWICINRHRGLTASNTLYTVRAKKPLGPQKLAGWALSFLSSFSRNQLKQCGRRYAQGLMKHEPGDISDVMLIEPQRFAGAMAAYQNCVDMMMGRAPGCATRTADTWLGEI